MRIWAISDLHLEFGDGFPHPCPPDADVCVIAGDLHSPLAESVRWAARNVAPEMPVVMVSGNHEFYGRAMDEVREEARSAARHPDVHLLEDDLVVVGGVRFVGATLWTDYRLYGGQPLAMETARTRMGDHSRIGLRRMPPQAFLPMHALAMHERSRAFLLDAMRIPFDGPTVVVTHHCPHPGSVHPKFAGDLLTAAFCSDLTDEIEIGRPDLWIHGHTHSSHDYVVGETRVVCNPRGYRDENRAFDPALVVEVRSRP